MPLSEVLYQDRAQERFQRALAVDRVPHAYLFTGPDGIGKEMLAARLAAVLLCPHPKQVQPLGSPDGALDTWQDACGQCVDCQLMAADNHPDFHRIYRTLSKLHPDKTIQRRKAVELGIDVIRHFLIEKIGLRPARGRAKVFIIIEAERLTPAAQNAMLKTLEEPPEHSHLILLAASADTLLDTTRSRCQQIAFAALPAEFIRTHLTEHQHLSPQDATFLAELAQGSLGAAVRCATYGLHEQVPRLLELLAGVGCDPLGCAKTLQNMAKTLGDKITKATKTSEDEEGVDLNAARRAQAMTMSMVSTILRDVLRAAVGHDAAALPSSPQISRLADRTTPQAVRQAIRAVNSAEYQIGRNANTGLIFDALAIALGRGLAPAATRHAIAR